MSLVVSLKRHHLSFQQSTPRPCIDRAALHWACGPAPSVRPYALSVRPCTWRTALCIERTALWACGPVH